MKLLAQFNPGNALFTNHGKAQSLAGNDIGTLISKLLPNVLVFASIIFFFLIVGGGFMMIKSAGGQGSPQDAAKAKAAVTYAIIGFLLVISAFFIMEVIKQITGVDFLSPKI